ncbi:MAG: HAD family phosphatase [Proteobacteria bacterium]|nr:HAD family phosphatase [Pseudomonadota bacterium]MBU1688566.1 HAD family phosphatase [Pseudomonadota bacterium]
MNDHHPTWCLFDFGGVLAEEGFTNGLIAIAQNHGLPPNNFVRMVTEIIYDCGYVTGKATETEFWNEVRKAFTISDNDRNLTNEIHSRFILRPAMMTRIKALKTMGVQTAILSDQTDWLEQLDRRDHFLHKFDPVLNSYHLGMTKRDPAIFLRAAKILAAPPATILFIDDNTGHIERAAAQGLQTHHFTDETTFFKDLALRGLT